MLSGDVVLVHPLKDGREVLFVLEFLAEDGDEDAVVVELLVDILHSRLAATHDVHHLAAVIV